MKRRFPRVLKRFAGFSLLFSLVLGAIVLRYHLFRSMQRGWRDVLLEEARPEEPGRDDVELAGRLRDLEGMDPERVRAAMTELSRKQGVDRVEVETVTLMDLNLDRAVPVNMRRGEGPEGEAGLWITLRDDQGREAGFHMPESEIGPEELRALRAFELIENTPMLEHIRPLLFDSLLRTLPGR